MASSRCSRSRQNTLSLQYLETLKDVGESPSTKWIFPMEFTNLIRPFTRMLSGDGGKAGDEPKA